MLIRCGNSAQLSETVLACNTGDDSLFSNIRENTKRKLPVISVRRETAQPAVIVGGGASLLRELEKIIALKEHGAKVFALNNAAKFLVEHGIRPDAQIMVDPRELNAEFVAEKYADEAYLASQCHPDVVRQAEASGYAVSLFHALIDNMDDHIYRGPISRLLKAAYSRFPWQWLFNLAGPNIKMGGGITVGLTGLCLVHALGHRQMHLFGYDSCHSENKSHAYRQDCNADDEMVRVAVKDRSFNASMAMAGQAHTFPDLCKMLEGVGCTIELYGDGLIQHIMKQVRHVPKVLSAVYDLGMCPPTYDFISFLSEAEKARIAQGLDEIDVVFQPGPLHGFRDDDLPPDNATRWGMLHRVCVSACRLLPSVRNVHVLKVRTAVAGNVFPNKYQEQHPRSHYGVGYFKNALPCLKATPSAVQYVGGKLKKPYATITLRESTYWPERNSNRPEWVKVAQWLHDRGIEPVFVPDTDGTPLKTWRTFTEAVDIDIRMALYEGAVVNLGISNGPMVLLYCSEAPYMIFRPVTEECHTTSAEWLESHGMKYGDKYAGNGKLVWENDTYDVIVRELERFMLMEAA
jgi:hypothetical protein